MTNTFLYRTYQYLVFHHLLCCCLFVSLQSSIIYWKATAAHLGRSFPNLVYCVAAAILVIYRSDKSLRSLLFTISPLSPFSKTNIADTLQQPNILPTLCFKDLLPEKESNTSLLIVSRSCLQKICATTKCHNCGKLPVLKQAIFQEIASIALNVLNKFKNENNVIKC